jgi:hypothetical protein
VQQIGLGHRFFVITDKDSEIWEPPVPGQNSFTWDVYHIENYLLASSFVREAVISLTSNDPFGSDAAVETALREAALKLRPNLVYLHLQKCVNDAILTAINVKGDSSSNDPANALAPSVRKSFERLKIVKKANTADLLAVQAEQIGARLDASFAGDQWLKELPGRDILKRFVNTNLKGVNYETFRWTIVHTMASAGYQPPGMKDVIGRIEAAGAD